MKTMVRCAALDMAALSKQETHGKRQDYTSKQRKVRDAAPVVYRGLNLRELYDAHMDGVKQNASAKRPVLHFLLRFPPELLDVNAKHFRGSRKERQTMMLRQAIAFIESTHGGDAVFAARIDRDEAGETIVDVFAAPRYEKVTKRTKPGHGAIWSSATKFGKDLCEKHQDEIQRRHPKAKGKLTGPRHVGIALNIEWRDWFQRANDVELSQKIEKETYAPDRLETEAYKDLQEQWDELAEAQAQLEADRVAFEDEAQSKREELDYLLYELKNIKRVLQNRWQRVSSFMRDFANKPNKTALEQLEERHAVKAGSDIANALKRLDALTPEETSEEPSGGPGF